MKKLLSVVAICLFLGFTSALTPEEDLEGYDEDDRFLGVNFHDALSRDVGIQNVTVNNLKNMIYLCFDSTFFSKK